MSSKLPESSSDDMLMLLAEARRIIGEWNCTCQQFGSKAAREIHGPRLVGINRAIHRQRQIEAARA